MESPIHNFLYNFLTLQEGQNIEEYREKNRCASGILRFPDEEDEEDKQEFYWECKWDDDSLEKMTRLCEFLKTNDLVYSDIIKLSESYLAELLNEDGWDKMEAHKTINNLIEVNVRMVDDGQLTDSFFLHF